MEYLPGQTLEELVERDGPLDPERAFACCARCVARWGGSPGGLIHRDIKPSNVMVVSAAASATWPSCSISAWSEPSQAETTMPI